MSDNVLNQEPIPAGCSLLSVVGLMLAAMSVESRRVHSVDFVLVPLLNVLSL